MNDTIHHTQFADANTEESIEKIDAKPKQKKINKQTNKLFGCNIHRVPDIRMKDIKHTCSNTLHPLYK